MSCLKLFTTKLHSPNRGGVNSRSNVKSFGSLLRRNTIVLCISLLFYALPSSAQMVFSFSDVAVTTKNLRNGVTLVEFPVGTDLATVMSKVSGVTVGGSTVNTSEIIPNPSTVSLTDDCEMTFLYQGKAYGFHFSEGKYFTAVFTTDPHIGQTDDDGTAIATMQAYVSKIVNIGKSGGAQFTFSALPGYVPTCDIAISLGDMDADSKTSSTDFNTAHQGYADAKIPLVVMCGNHDLVPDYWTGEKGGKGLTYGLTGGSTCNNTAIKTTDSYRTALSSYGITDATTITDGTKHKQFNPYTFTFNGVRFFVGQTYWFQKPYTAPTLTKSATYYAPDGVISALETFVNNNAKGQPAVWMQHYPFVSGSDIDRYWLDMNDVGRFITTSDASAYGTNDANIAGSYISETAKAYAKKKKDKMTEIMKLTKNPVNFSGHSHFVQKAEYNGITDYTAAPTGKSDTEGFAYVVLMKGNKGVVEVKEFRFNIETIAGGNDVKQDILPADAQATAVKMAEGLQNMGITVANDKKLSEATNADMMKKSMDAMSEAFQTYITNNGGSNVDVTKLLGDNTDFETTEGAAYANITNVKPQTGWTEVVESYSTSDNSGFIHLRQATDQGATTNSLYVRAKWQDNSNSRLQVLKQCGLPAGVYELKYKLKTVGTFSENLNYIECGGLRYMTQLSEGKWTERKQLICLDEPSTLTVSFGFAGEQGENEYAVNIDDLTLTYVGAFTSGTEMTSLIKNPTFTEGTTAKEVQGDSGQVYAPNEWDFAYSYEGWKDTKFIDDGSTFNAWAGTIKRAELSQDITLPNGVYRLSADVHTSSPASSSTIALYGFGDNQKIARSEEAWGNSDDKSPFYNYSCTFEVTNGTATIGIRSDKAYYQVKNFKLVYLGSTVNEETGQETDNSYLRQDYYWNGRNNLEFDATKAKYSKAKGVVVYPQNANQLVKALSGQFADMTNKIVDGTCETLKLTDKADFNSSSSFTATTATFDRSFSAGTISTVCLPFAPTGYSGTFFELTSVTDNYLIFTSVDNPQPNTPYIYKGDANELLSGNNVDVAATPSTEMKGNEVDGYFLKGVYKTTPVSDIFGFSTDGKLLKATTAKMNQFRAFIQSPEAVANSKIGFASFDGTTTALDNMLFVEKGKKVDVVSAGGAVVRHGVDAGKALEGLQKGVYVIVNGSNKQKVIKR